MHIFNKFQWFQIDFLIEKILFYVKKVYYDTYNEYVMLIWKLFYAPFFPFT